MTKAENEIICLERTIMNDASSLRIEAAHKTIAEVFSNQYAFGIPSYQRPYAWESTQVEELLADLTEAMQPAQGADGFYFLGSIVLVKTHGSPEARVIDGQQRLTTLTILFSVLRDLTKDGQARIKRERYVKQVADADLGLKEKLRLQLRKKDQPFFERHVQTNGATATLPSLDSVDGSKARIVENADIVRKRLIEMGEERRSDLIRFMLQSCYLVVVEVPTDTAARRIFTVLNARGLDLTATDILKAELIERAGEDQEATLAERWENHEAALGRESFNDLFVQIRMIFQREKPRSSLESGFPVSVPIIREKPLEFMDKVLDRYAEAFALTSDDQKLRSRFGAGTAQLVKSLHRLDNKDWLAPLLFVFGQADEGAAIDVPEFVFKLERVAYYMFVIRADVNARMARYADVLDGLDPRNAPEGEKKERKERSTGLILGRDEAFAMFEKLNGAVYTVTRVVKPLLLRLEQASHDGSASYDYPTVTVEHVCPQTVADGSQWQEWFPSQEEHADLVHRLGNLVLLNFRKNSSASNYDFGKKKSTYFVKDNTSAFTLTAEVRDFDRWSPTDIRQRQDDVMNRLTKTWRLVGEYQSWREQRTDTE
jgi:hypothetical protein